MRRRMSNPRVLNVRHYADILIGLNDYLAAFLGAKVIRNIGEMALNEIPLEITSNGWSKQAYVQSFYCENVTFSLSMCFDACKLWKEPMKVLYKFLIKKYTRPDDNRYGCSRQNRGESSLSKIDIDMGKHYGRSKQRCVYHPRD